jgi:hypothetical protein
MVLDDWHGSKQASDGVLLLFFESIGNNAPPGLSGGYEGQCEVVDSRQSSATKKYGSFYRWKSPGAPRTTSRIISLIELRIESTFG